MALARALYDYYSEDQQQLDTADSAHNALLGGTRVFLLDDPFGSSDPRVTFNIFNKLFGSNGLLRDAAVVLTIDETSLAFLLRSFDNNNNDAGLSVTLKTQRIDRGHLAREVANVDRVYLGGMGRVATLSEQTISTQADGIVTESTPTIATTPTTDNWDHLEEEIEGDNNANQMPLPATLAEPAYSGAVGSKTYW